MYAIRSYYVHPVVGAGQTHGESGAQRRNSQRSRMARHRAGADVRADCRITSYNVCYTKLLREKPVQAPERAAKPVKQSQKKGKEKSAVPRQYNLGDYL